LRFWKKSTPIGFVFGLGLALGFVVGVVVCYQILATEISDHMAELATLKAMGYSPRFFLFFVLEESLYLAVLGFIPGVIGAAICYAGLASATGLLMRLSLDRAGAVFVLTLAMCVVSGLLAIRRLHTAAPADLFA
jgi:putative ABC transport system permease protein